MRAAFFFLLLSLPARAQEAAPPPPAAPTPAAAAPDLGIPLPRDKGPWLIGDVAFLGNQAIGAFSLQAKVRARRGMLYTPTDLAGDLKALQEFPGVLTARAAIYAIPGSPVPDSYQPISVSTMLARVVFTIEEKGGLPGLTPAATTQAPAPDPAKGPPVSLGGVVLTPTAYRGYGRYTSPGLAFDVNAAYFIGRLYGRNSVSTRRTNSLDRLGVWLLTFDEKMQIQSEGDWRPAVAVGSQQTVLFRDAPHPGLNTTQNFTVNVSQDRNKIFTGGYVVASKKVFGVRSSAGFMYGSAGEQVAYLTEFLSPQALKFYYNRTAGPPDNAEIQATSKSTLFGSLMLLPRPQYPLAVEIVKPNGMPLSPILLNFKIGYFLKLNFDLAYLRFQGGWDLLGTFQFRYTQYPRK